MSDEQQYELALKIATEAHKGQVDKSGVDYIKHPIAVASFCKNPLAKVAALLHDVIEDTDITEEDLRARGIEDDIIFAALIQTVFGQSMIPVVFHHLEMPGTPGILHTKRIIVVNIGIAARIITNPERNAVFLPAVRDIFILASL